MGAADTVFFAIQAGLRLYGTMRRAYVTDTMGRPLVLPLPRAPGVEYDSADSWFAEDPVGREAAARQPRILELLALPDLTPVQKGELLDAYQTLRPAAYPTEDDPTGLGRMISGDELAAMLTVRQWEEDDPGAPHSVLQQIAGTVVNLTVDWFAHTPGAVSKESGSGRALLAFLAAIDDTDFAGIPPGEIAGTLLLSVLESVAATPELIAGGEKGRLLVSEVVKSLSESAAARLTNATADERWQAAGWLQLLARSLLAGGAKVVMEHPARFLGADAPGEQALVRRVGATLTELVIGEDSVTFTRLLSRDGVEKLVRSVLESLAENPDLLRFGSGALKNVLAAVAGDLAKLPAPFSPDMFPEVVRLLLANSADQLDMLFPKRFQRADRHLLVVATRELLTRLAKVPPGATWAPTLTPSQLLEVLDAVFLEVRENPGWVVDRAREKSDRLARAIDASLAALRGRDPGRLSAETGLEVLLSGISAAGVRIELLDPVEPDGPAVLTLALNAILDPLFEADEEGRAWELARGATLAVLVDLGLAALARHGAGPEELAVLADAMAALLAGRKSFDPDAFAADLTRRLTGNGGEG